MFFLSAVRTNSRKVALQAPDFYLLLAKRPVLARTAHFTLKFDMSYTACPLIFILLCFNP